MQAILVLIAGFWVSAQVGLAADHASSSTWTKTTRVTRRVAHVESSPYVTLIRISANVDGSDQFIFTPRSVRWKHKFWSDPTDVRFNGKPWTDLHHSPPGWNDLGRHLDLSRAWIVKRQGRDVVALERTATGFDLYFCDSPNKSAHYDAVIAVPRRVGPSTIARGPSSGFSVSTDHVARRFAPPPTPIPHPPMPGQTGKVYR